MEPRSTTRRAFLRFLAASPLFASLDLWGCAETGAPPGKVAGGPAQGAVDSTPGLISSADDALDVFDFRAVAQRRLPPAHWGYMATGVDGEATLRANEEGFARLYLRPRRLVDVTTVDTRVRIFDREWPSPIALSPVSGQLAFHPDRELGSARAARSSNTLQILSTVANSGVEEVAEARGEPTWYQLYPTSRWDVTQALVARAEQTGCPAIVLTVDLPVDSNRLTAARLARSDTRDCSACHGAPNQRESTYFAQKPMFRGLSLRRPEMRASALTWDFVNRLRDITKAKLLLKGIVTHEDATLALRAGIDGVIVSNHGGRAEESGRATIDSLPEVVEAVGGRIPVLMDGGVRRGNDVFKALARGARAVCIGRPYVWGLAAFGQPGVEKVIGLLRAELERTMRLAGTTAISRIGPASIGRG
ncbi:MAG TPA: alpha-hydroxy acid oxidase [Gemmatimonadales bacterium]|nr:alpha-hydroxy acid oxidase [Gemmatimonadales bacterium]